MLFLLLLACSSTPTPTVPAAVHAASATVDDFRDEAGLALLVVRPDGAQWRNAAVTADTFDVSADPLESGVLVAVHPDVPWSDVAPFLTSLGERVSVASLVVSDPVPNEPFVPTPGPAVDVGFLAAGFTMRTGANQPLATGAQPRLLGAVSGSPGVHARVPASVPTSAVTAVFDAAHGQGVHCFSAQLDPESTATVPSLAGQTVRVTGDIGVIPLTLRGAEEGCSVEPEAPVGMAPTGGVTEIVLSDVSALDAAAVEAVLDPIRPVVRGCLPIPPTVSDPGAEPAAVLNLDVAADGNVVGIKVMAFSRDGATRVGYERCLASAVASVRFPEAPTPTRLLWTVTP